MSKIGSAGDGTPTPRQSGVAPSASNTLQSMGFDDPTRVLMEATSRSQVELARVDRFSHEFSSQLHDCLQRVKTASGDVATGAKSTIALVGLLIAQINRSQDYVAAARLARDLEQRTAAACRRQAADATRARDSAVAEADALRKRLATQQLTMDRSRKQEGCAQSDLERREGQLADVSEALESQLEANAVLRVRVIELERVAARLRAASARSPTDPALLSTTSSRECFP